MDLWDIIYIYLCDFVFCEIIKKSQEMFIFFQSFTNYELQKMVKNKRKVCFLFSIILPTLKVDEDYWMISCDSTKGKIRKSTLNKIDKITVTNNFQVVYGYFFH